MNATIQESFAFKEPSTADFASLRQILPFCPDMIMIWFELVEALMAEWKIYKDESMFNFVIVMLGEDYIHLVSDILYDPPRKDMYAHLKEKLIKRVVGPSVANLIGNHQMRRLQSVRRQLDFGD